MQSTSNSRRLTTTILSGALAALVLAGCGKHAAQPTGSSQSAQAATPAADPSAVPAPADALPLTDSSGPAAVAPAPAALPAAPRIPVAHLRDQSQRYAYLDRATSMRDAFGDAPPDYTYDYEGVHPWVWRSADNATQVVEPLADGNRSYYYRPGSAAPYLISDGGYSYGYDNGQLVIVYDSSGRPLPPAQIDQRVDLAARYLQRARLIYQASLNAQRQAVARNQWLARREAWTAEESRWRQAQQQDAEWRAYRDQYARDEDARWAAERYRREAEAARLAASLNDQQAARRAWQAALAARDRAPRNGPPLNGPPGLPAPLPPPGQHYPPPGALPGPPPPIGPSSQDNARAAAKAAAQANAEAARQARLAAAAQAQAAAQQQALAQAQAKQQAMAAQAQRQKLAADQAQARAQAQAKAQAGATTKPQGQATAPVKTETKSRSPASMPPEADTKTKAEVAKKQAAADRNRHEAPTPPGVNAPHS